MIDDNNREREIVKNLTNKYNTNKKKAEQETQYHAEQHVKVKKEGISQR
jgi:hypothetical protein